MPKKKKAGGKKKAKAKDSAPASEDAASRALHEVDALKTHLGT
jgi:hypothetical protein